MNLWLSRSICVYRKPVLNCLMLQKKRLVGFPAGQLMKVAVIVPAPFMVAVVEVLAGLAITIEPVVVATVHLLN